MHFRNIVTCYLIALIAPLAISVSFSTDTQASGTNPDVENTDYIGDVSLRINREKRQTRSIASSSTGKSTTGSAINAMQIRVSTKRQKILAAPSPNVAESGMAFVKKDNSISVSDPGLKAISNKAFNYPMETPPPVELHHRSFNFPGIEPHPIPEVGRHTAATSGHNQGSSARVGGTSNLDVLTRLSAPVSEQLQAASFQELRKAILTHHARQLLKTVIENNAAFNSHVSKSEQFEPRTPGTMSAGHLNHLQIRNRPAHFDRPGYKPETTNSFSDRLAEQTHGNQDVFVGTSHSSDRLPMRAIVPDINPGILDVPQIEPLPAHQETFLKSQQDNLPSSILGIPLNHPMTERHGAFRIATSRVTSPVEIQQTANVASRSGNTKTGPPSVQHATTINGHSTNQHIGTSLGHQTHHKTETHNIINGVHNPTAELMISPKIPQTTPRTNMQSRPSTTPPTTPQMTNLPKIGTITFNGNNPSAVRKDTTVTHSSSLQSAIAPASLASSPAIGNTIEKKSGKGNSNQHTIPPHHPIINLHINFHQPINQQPSPESAVQQHPIQPAGNHFLASGQNKAQHIDLSRMMTHPDQPMLDMNVIHNITQAVVASLIRRNQAVPVIQPQQISQANINTSPAAQGQQPMQNRNSVSSGTANHKPSMNLMTSSGHNPTGQAAPTMQLGVHGQQQIRGNIAAESHKHTSASTRSQSKLQAHAIGTEIGPTSNSGTQTFPQQHVNVHHVNPHPVRIQTNTIIQPSPGQLIGSKQQRSMNKNSPSTGNLNTASINQRKAGNVNPVTVPQYISGNQNTAHSQTVSQLTTGNKSVKVRNINFRSQQQPVQVQEPTTILTSQSATGRHIPMPQMLKGVGTNSNLQYMELPSMPLNHPLHEQQNFQNNVGRHSTSQQGNHIPPANIHQGISSVPQSVNKQPQPQQKHQQQHIGNLKHQSGNTPKDLSPGLSSTNAQTPAQKTGSQAGINSISHLSTSTSAQTSQNAQISPQNTASPTGINNIPRTTINLARQFNSISSSAGTQTSNITKSPNEINNLPQQSQITGSQTGMNAQPQPSSNTAPQFNTVSSATNAQASSQNIGSQTGMNSLPQTSGNTARQFITVSSITNTQTSSQNTGSQTGMNSPPQTSGNTARQFITVSSVTNGQTTKPTSQQAMLHPISIENKIFSNPRDQQMKTYPGQANDQRQNAHVSQVSKYQPVVGQSTITQSASSTGSHGNTIWKQIIDQQGSIQANVQSQVSQNGQPGKPKSSATIETTLPQQTTANQVSQPRNQGSKTPPSFHRSLTNTQQTSFQAESTGRQTQQADLGNKISSKPTNKQNDLHTIFSNRQGNIVNMHEQLTRSKGNTVSLQSSSQERPVLDQPMKHKGKLQGHPNKGSQRNTITLTPNEHLTSGSQASRNNQIIQKNNRNVQTVENQIGQQNNLEPTISAQPPNQNSLLVQSRGSHISQQRSQGNTFTTQTTNQNTLQTLSTKQKPSQQENTNSVQPSNLQKGVNVGTGVQPSSQLNTARTNIMDLSKNHNSIIFSNTQAPQNGQLPNSVKIIPPPSTTLIQSSRVPLPFDQGNSITKKQSSGKTIEHTHSSGSNSIPVSQSVAIVSQRQPHVNQPTEQHKTAQVTSQVRQNSLIQSTGQIGQPMQSQPMEHGKQQLAGLSPSQVGQRSGGQSHDQTVKQIPGPSQGPIGQIQTSGPTGQHTSRPSPGQVGQQSVSKSNVKQISDLPQGQKSQGHSLSSSGQNAPRQSPPQSRQTGHQESGHTTGQHSKHITGPPTSQTVLYTTGGQVTSSSTKPKQIVGLQLLNKQTNSQRASPGKPPTQSPPKSSQNSVVLVGTGQITGSPKLERQRTKSSLHTTVTSKPMDRASNLNSNTHFSGGASVTTSTKPDNVLASQNIQHSSPIGWVSPIVSDINRNQPQGRGQIGQQNGRPGPSSSSPTSGSSTGQLEKSTQQNSHIPNRSSSTPSGTNSNMQKTSDPRGKTAVIQNLQTTGQGNQVSTPPEQFQSKSNQQNIQPVVNQLSMMSKQHKEAKSPKTAEKSVLRIGQVSPLHTTRTSVGPGSTNGQHHTRVSNTATRGLKVNTLSVTHNSASPSTIPQLSQPISHLPINRIIIPQKSPQNNLLPAQTGTPQSGKQQIPVTSPRKESKNRPQNSLVTSQMKLSQQSNPVTSQLMATPNRKQTSLAMSQNEQRNRPVTSQMRVSQNGGLNNPTTALTGQQNNPVTSQMMMSQNRQLNNPVLSPVIASPTGLGQQNNRVNSQMTTSQTGQLSNRVKSQIWTPQTGQQQKNNLNSQLDNIQKTSSKTVTSLAGQNSNHVTSSHKKTAPNNLLQHSAKTLQIVASPSQQQNKYITLPQIGTFQNSQQSNMISAQNSQQNSPVTLTQRANPTSGQQNNRAASTQVGLTQPVHLKSPASSTKSVTLSNSLTRNTIVHGHKPGSTLQGTVSAGVPTGNQPNTIPSTGQTGRRGTSRQLSQLGVLSSASAFTSNSHDTLSKTNPPIAPKSQSIASVTTSQQSSQSNIYPSSHGITNTAYSTTDFGRLSPDLHLQDVASTNFAFLHPGSISGHSNETNPQGNVAELRSSASIIELAYTLGGSTEKPLSNQISEFVPVQQNLPVTTMTSALNNTTATAMAETILLAANVTTGSNPPGTTTISDNNSTSSSANNSSSLASVNMIPSVLNAQPSTFPFVVKTRATATESTTTTVATTHPSAATQPTRANLLNASSSAVPAQATTTSLTGPTRSNAGLSAVPTAATTGSSAGPAPATTSSSPGQARRTAGSSARPALTTTSISAGPAPATTGSSGNQAPKTTSSSLGPAQTTAGSSARPAMATTTSSASQVRLTAGSSAGPAPATIGSSAGPPPATIGSSAGPAPATTGSLAGPSQATSGSSTGPAKATTGPSPATTGSSAGPAPATIGSSAIPSPATIGSSAGPAPATIGSSAGPSPATIGSSAGPAPATIGSSAIPSPATIGSSAIPPPATIGSLAGPSPATIGSSAGPAPATIGSSAGPSPATIGSSAGPSPATIGSSIGPAQATTGSSVGPASATTSSSSGPAPKTTNSSSGSASTTISSSPGLTQSNTDSSVGQSSAKISSSASPKVTTPARTNSSARATTGSTADPNTATFNSSAKNPATNGSSEVSTLAKTNSPAGTSPANYTSATTAQVTTSQHHPTNYTSATQVTTSQLHPENYTSATQVTTSHHPANSSTYNSLPTSNPSGTFPETKNSSKGTTPNSSNSISTSVFNSPAGVVPLEVIARIIPTVVDRHQGTIPGTAADSASTYSSSTTLQENTNSTGYTVGPISNASNSKHNLSSKQSASTVVASHTGLEGAASEVINPAVKISSKGKSSHRSLVIKRLYPQAVRYADVNSPTGSSRPGHKLRGGLQRTLNISNTEEVSVSNIGKSAASNTKSFPTQDPRKVQNITPTSENVLLSKTAPDGMHVYPIISIVTPDNATRSGVADVGDVSETSAMSTHNGTTQVSYEVAASQSAKGRTIEPINNTSSSTKTVTTSAVGQNEYAKTIQNNGLLDQNSINAIASQILTSLVKIVSLQTTKESHQNGIDILPSDMNGQNVSNVMSQQAVHSQQSVESTRRLLNSLEQSSATNGAKHRKIPSAGQARESLPGKDSQSTQSLQVMTKHSSSIQNSAVVEKTSQAGHPTVVNRVETPYRLETNPVSTSLPENSTTLPQTNIVNQAISLLQDRFNTSVSTKLEPPQESVLNKPGQGKSSVSSHTTIVGQEIRPKQSVINKKMSSPLSLSQSQYVGNTQTSLTQPGQTAQQQKQTDTMSQTTPPQQTLGYQVAPSQLTDVTGQTSQVTTPQPILGNQVAKFPHGRLNPVKLDASVKTIPPKLTTVHQVAQQQRTGAVTHATKATVRKSVTASPVIDMTTSIQTNIANQIFDQPLPALTRQVTPMQQSTNDKTAPNQASHVKTTTQLNSNQSKIQKQGNIQDPSRSPLQQNGTQVPTTIPPKSRQTTEPSVPKRATPQHPTKQTLQKQAITHLPTQPSLRATLQHPTKQTLEKQAITHLPTQPSVLATSQHPTKQTLEKQAITHLPTQPSVRATPQHPTKQTLEKQAITHLPTQPSVPKQEAQQQTYHAPILKKTIQQQPREPKQVTQKHRNEPKQTTQQQLNPTSTKQSSTSTKLVVSKQYIKSHESLPVQSRWNQPDQGIRPVSNAAMHHPSPSGNPNQSVINYVTPSQHTSSKASTEIIMKTASSGPALIQSNSTSQLTVVTQSASNHLTLVTHNVTVTPPQSPASNRTDQSKVGIHSINPSIAPAESSTRTTAANKTSVKISSVAQPQPKQVTIVAVTANPMSWKMVTFLNEQMKDLQATVDKTGRNHGKSKLGSKPMGHRTGITTTPSSRHSPGIIDTSPTLHSAGTMTKPKSIHESGTRTRTTRTKVTQDPPVHNTISETQLSLTESRVDTVHSHQNQLPDNSINRHGINRSRSSGKEWEFAAIAAGIIGSTSSPTTTQAVLQNVPVIPDVPKGLVFLSKSKRRERTHSKSLLRKIISNSLKPENPVQRSIGGLSQNTANTEEQMMMKGTDVKNKIVQPILHGERNGEINQVKSSIVQSNFQDPILLERLVSSGRMNTESVDQPSAFQASPMSLKNVKHGPIPTKVPNHSLQEKINTSEQFNKKDIVNGISSNADMLRVLKNSIDKQRMSGGTGNGKTKSKQPSDKNNNVDNTPYSVNQVMYPVDISLSALEMMVDVPHGRLNPVKPVKKGHTQ